MKTLRNMALVGLAVLGTAAVTSCNNGSNSDTSTESKYTYNAAFSNSPTNWNQHTYQTNDDSLILNYTTGGFYTFDYNEDKTGYKMVLDMADAFPVDVTQDFVGEQWGIKAGDKSRAWKISLRDDLKWEDGTPITAASFVESAKFLLNPQAKNYRADQMYKGDVVLHNAKNYLYQGSTVGSTCKDTYEVYDPTNDGNLYFTWGNTYALKEAVGDKFPKGSTIEQATFRKLMGMPDSWNGEKAAAYFAANVLAYPEGTKDEEKFTAKDLYELEMKTLAQIKADAKLNKIWTGIINEWKTQPNEELDFFVCPKVMPAVDFENVGVKDVNGDLVIIMDNPLEGFYLNYWLGSSWLVEANKYKANEKIENGIYSNLYGTSVSTYSSYGPYKLTEFQADKSIVFERNEHWYGYNDRKPGAGYYQADKLTFTKIAQDSTRLQSFLKGDIDEYGLTANDMAKYQSSENLYYSTTESTFFVAINPGKGTDQADHVLNNLDFRKAMSFAIDRKAFALATSPMNNPGKALFSDLIISDPELGKSYRSEELAKDVLLDFWGLADQVGPGKKFATKDDAIAAINGVDLAQAKEKFNAAYDQLVAEGKYTGGEFKIVIGTPNNSSSFYNDGYELLVDTWTKAAVGTKFEGKLKFDRNANLGNAFGEKLRNGEVDLLFGVGWKGSALNPFSLVSAYTDPENQYDTANNYAEQSLSIHFDSVKVKKAVQQENGSYAPGEEITLTNTTLTTSILQWSREAMKDYVEVVDGEGKDANHYFITCNSSAEYETRIKILTSLEGAILSNYTNIPLLDDSHATLRGHKINYGTEHYVFGMGFGGVKYITFNYDDAAWANHVKSQGGKLTY